MSEENKVKEIEMKLAVVEKEREEAIKKLEEESETRYTDVPKSIGKYVSS